MGAERNGEMECRWNSPEGEEEREDISSPGTPPGSLMSYPQRFQMSNSSQAHCQRVVVTNLLYVRRHCFLFCCVSILCLCVFAPRLPAHYWWLVAAQVRSSHHPLDHCTAALNTAATLFKCNSGNHTQFRLAELTY